jgi:hypothetical protein
MIGENRSSATLPAPILFEGSVRDRKKLVDPREFHRRHTAERFSPAGLTTHQAQLIADAFGLTLQENTPAPRVLQTRPG